MRFEISKPPTYIHVRDTESSKSAIEESRERKKIFKIEKNFMKL